MANESDESRRWEVICVDSADGEFVVYVEGKDSTDNENYFFTTREAADTDFEFYAEFYRENYPDIYAGIYLFDDNSKLVREYHFGEVKCE